MKRISEEATKYIKRSSIRKELWKKFAIGKNCSKESKPFTYFMAGAPGSGKTEIVKNHLIRVFKNCIVADADEIRLIFPDYNGKNSYLFQKASSKGVDILYDKALQKGYNILIDGTFALNFEKCRENIFRSIKRGRTVIIFYLYTHPSIAWSYAKKREYFEGRKIRITTFIKAFFGSRKNVNRIKKEFGDKVYIVGMRNNYKKDLAKIRVDIRNVDEIQKISYTWLSLFLRVFYANMVLEKERLLWTIKRMLKK